MKPKYIIAILALLIIGGLEFYALSKGINGTLFGAATAGVGAIAGYVLKSDNNKV